MMFLELLRDAGLGERLLRHLLPHLKTRIEVFSM
jgi:hypothetical protein